MFLQTSFQSSLNFSHPGNPVKSFIIPENVDYVTQHTALSCYNHKNACKTLSVPNSISQLFHYRDEVMESEFGATRVDTRLWKYKKLLVEKVRNTLKEIDFDP